MEMRFYEDFRKMPNQAEIEMVAEQLGATPEPATRIAKRAGLGTFCTISALKMLCYKQRAMRTEGKKFPLYSTGRRR